MAIPATRRTDNLGAAHCHHFAGSEGQKSLKEKCQTFPTVGSAWLLLTPYKFLRFFKGDFDSLEFPRKSPL